MRVSTAGSALAPPSALKDFVRVIPGPGSGIRLWALRCEQQRGHNIATEALANRMARIAWATWKHQRDFGGNWALA